MRDCETRQESIKAYQDGELALWKRIEVRLHLARCESCRGELKAMQEVSRKLRSTDEGGLDPALRARILASVTYSSSEPREKSPTQTARPRLRRRPLILWGAAAAGVILGLFYRIYLIPASAPGSAREESFSASRPEGPAHLPSPGLDGPTPSAGFSNTAGSPPTQEEASKKAMPSQTGGGGSFRGGGAGFSSSNSAGTKSDNVQNDDVVDQKVYTASPASPDTTHQAPGGRSAVTQDGHAKLKNVEMQPQRNGSLADDKAQVDILNNAPTVEMKKKEAERKKLQNSRNSYGKNSTGSKQSQNAQQSAKPLPSSSPAKPSRTEKK